MTEIRAYRPTDHDDVYRICVETGDSGTDATGLFRNDDLLPDIYAGPYLVHDPDLVLLVDDGDGAIGYVLGTADSAAYTEWFRTEWWPTVADKYAASAAAGAADAGPAADGDSAPPVSEREASIIASAADFESAPADIVERYPAHLHIDLLPVTQGQGLGRQLIERFTEELRERGVRGVHLGVDRRNTGAHRFYERTGFTRVGDPDGPVWYAKEL
ncbi:GNAT family N-acetyltransferase [Plantibacter sp. YIM 135249]|uniref:GNAT family N-acetyltransferase n=1 Tax=Plantibacter sp. YIM 135249 TaxID=3423918 RepID=UPI003D33B942